VRNTAGVPTDVTVLRALAHPVRNRILSELTAQGSLRAADVARELGIPANQASFHLRQLAKYGLVEEDPDAGRDKRDRVWRATEPQGHDISLSEVEEASPEGRAAGRAFRSQGALRGHQLVDAAYGEKRVADAQRSVHDGSVRLTKAEAQELSQELGALLQSWAERTRGRDGSRRTYSVFAMLQPEPEPTRDEP
jgi:DNA-binding transcriptional ArsR family regulator